MSRSHGSEAGGVVRLGGRWPFEAKGMVADTIKGLRLPDRGIQKDFDPPSKIMGEAHLLELRTAWV